MSTYKLMEHERMRWETMTDKQLITRLGKITQMDKLECFIRLCREYPDRHYLIRHAENRKAQLMGASPVYWGREAVQQAKESFYEKVSGYKYSQPKAVAKALRQEKPETRVIKSDERYLDF